MSISLSVADVAHFRTFGFVVVRSLVVVTT